MLERKCFNDLWVSTTCHKYKWIMQPWLLQYRRRLFLTQRWISKWVSSRPLSREIERRYPPFVPSSPSTPLFFPNQRTTNPLELPPPHPYPYSLIRPFVRKINGTSNDTTENRREINYCMLDYGFPVEEMGLINNLLILDALWFNVLFYYIWKHSLELIIKWVGESLSLWIVELSTCIITGRAVYIIWIKFWLFSLY